MKVVVGILEDEIKEKEITVQMLTTFFNEEKIPFEVKYYSTGKDLLNDNIFDINLLLLDIILPNENGVEIAKKVRELSWKGPLIFISKTIQFALDGYKVEAMDYLLKPLEYSDFKLKLLKAYKIINSLCDHEIVIKTNEGVANLLESQIYYVEVNKHYLTIHSKKGDYVFRGTMAKMVEQLSSRFASSSNSFLVNLDAIDLIKNNEVVINNESVPLTRNYKKDFLRKYLERKG